MDCPGMLQMGGLAESLVGRAHRPLLVIIHKVSPIAALSPFPGVTSLVVFLWMGVSLFALTPPLFDSLRVDSSQYNWVFHCPFCFVLFFCFLDICNPDVVSSSCQAPVTVPLP